MRESVWDYPRPPRVEGLGLRARVVVGELDVANSNGALRVLETSHPPVIYFPPQDVRMEYLEAVAATTVCEWKGTASYFDLVIGRRRLRRAAWTYRRPEDGYAQLKDHVAFYPSRVDACFIGEERVCAQEGDFYGGWITSDITGPFKGGRGTEGW